MLIDHLAAKQSQICWRFFISTKNQKSKNQSYIEIFTHFQKNVNANEKLSTGCG